VTVSEQGLTDAMAVMMRDLKLAAEPAPAATVAALAGPLRDRLAGKRVGLVLSGTNIDPATHAKLVARARE